MKRILKEITPMIQSLKTAAAAVLLSGLAFTAFTQNALAADSARNVALEEQNRAVVLKFYDEFFNKHKTQEAAKVLVDDYKQHNPDVPDGKAPFVDYFTGFFKENPQSRARIVRSAADGDLVWLHVQSTNGPKDRGQAVLDVFRLKDGRIVEHWDVTQDVPAEAANKNTMF